MPTESKKPQSPAETLYITIGKNEYAIKFPTTGQEIDIAILLQQISSDRYESMKLSRLPQLAREAIKIETIAYFNVLIGKELREHLTVKSLFDLKRDQMDTLMLAYLNEFLPWYENWQTVFNYVEPTEDDKK